MVSWRTEGIALMSLGVIMIVGALVITYLDSTVSDLEACGFGLAVLAGLVLIAIGAWTCYLAWKTGEWKGVLASIRKRP